MKLVSIGGTVVYSTCSLSPIQNDGVVQVALKRAWQENNCVMVVKYVVRIFLYINNIITYILYYLHKLLTYCIILVEI